MSEHQAGGPSSAAPMAFAQQRGAHWAPHRSDEVAASADEFENQFKIRIVDNSSRRIRASTLIQRRYAWRGYSCSPLTQNEHGRVTLSACVEDTTVATITAALDSPDGLYVSRLYPQEVEALRGEGRKLCEFTKLAVDESVRSHAVLGAIFHVAYLYVIDLHGCTDVVIEVNPRHVKFYQRMLGFKRIGSQRIDPVVNAPAVLMHLDLAHSTAEINRLGGRRGACEGERSFYPYFFAPDEAEQIVGRLRSH